MRLLFTIPHYFAPAPAGGHGSLTEDRAARRRVLTATLTRLRQVFGSHQYLIDIARRRAEPVPGRSDARLDVVVCTSGDDHLLDDLKLTPGAYRRVATDVEPPLLGFACREVLRDAIGSYDYYCYLEDDLLLDDPWFFAKLRWFNELAGESALLQPNRFERDAQAGGRKAYVDGDLVPEATAAFQDVTERPVVSAPALGATVSFRRPLNPHSGCYFLNRAQMSHWSAQPHFEERDAGFVGPLESAATLGVMRTFRIYKPASECVSFLEVEHLARRFISLIPTN